MSPLYDYACGCGLQVTRLRKWQNRLDPVTCECGETMEPLFPVPHLMPDGVYSYAPNLGTREAFDRKQAKIEKLKEERKDGIKRRGAVGDNEV